MRILGALIEAIEAGAPAPEVVFVTAPVVDARAHAAIGEHGARPSERSGAPISSGSEVANVAQAARTGTRQALELLQAWLACPELADARLVLLTSGAVEIDEAQAPDLVTAPLWGLLRTAQSEHPDRFLIVDRDPDRRGRRRVPRRRVAGDAGGRGAAAGGAWRMRLRAAVGGAGRWPRGRADGRADGPRNPAPADRGGSLASRNQAQHARGPGAGREPART